MSLWFFLCAKKRTNDVSLVLSLRQSKERIPFASFRKEETISLLVRFLGVSEKMNTD